MARFFIVLVLVVSGLGLAGWINYERNAHLDQELADRPYATLSDADLEALIEAYDQERARWAARSRSGDDRTRVMDGYAPSDLQGKLQAFDRFQRKNEAWREANRARLDQEVVIEALRREQDIRNRGLHRERNRILRRLLTL